jgi:2-amino-4-hydroxy-6-hydroxymethyldihydropteridine diphosphokinase
MPQVLLGMGSNIDPEAHLKDAAKVIHDKFPQAQFSQVYRSAAVGMDGDDFLNACCLLEHDLSEHTFSAWLKDLEDQHGRDRSQGSWKPRTLDLDVLMVDGKLLDEDLYKYGHIYVPASELVSYKALDTAAFAPLEHVQLTL